MQSQQRRETKYTRAVRLAIASLGHATNAQLASHLRQDFPELSDTTVHRVTTRLCENGELGVAPPAPDGAQQFDANLSSHDHFVCGHCGRLRDITVPDTCRAMIQAELGGCKVNGPLVISGNCHACLSGEYDNKEVEE